MYIMIICHGAILHYNMSFKTIAGRSDGVFWWFPALSEDQAKKLLNSPKLSCGFERDLDAILWKEKKKCQYSQFPTKLMHWVYTEVLFIHQLGEFPITFNFRWLTSVTWDRLITWCKWDPCIIHLSFIYSPFCKWSVTSRHIHAILKNCAAIMGFGFA